MNIDDDIEHQETLYQTIDDYKEQVVIPSLGDYADEHDVDAIADEMTEWHEEVVNGNIMANKSGLVVRSDKDFWQVVEKHAYDTIDLNSLNWIEPSWNTEGLYGAQEAELSNGDVLILAYEGDDTDESSMSAEVKGRGNEHPDTGDTRHWPYFDDKFGRDHWQKFLAEHAERCRAEIEECDDEEVD